MYKICGFQPNGINKINKSQTNFEVISVYYNSEPLCTGSYVYELSYYLANFGKGTPRNQGIPLPNSLNSTNFGTVFFKQN